MHQALKIQEILFIIFGYSSSESVSQSGYSESRTLAALARTCRAFKEPALSVLWRVLIDLSPLARCLPEASNLLRNVGTQYSFTRPLTKTEWDTLQSYTRRVRSILDFYCGLDEGSLRTISDRCPADGQISTLCMVYMQGKTRASYTCLSHPCFSSMSRSRIYVYSRNLSTRSPNASQMSRNSSFACIYLNPHLFASNPVTFPAGKTYGL
ncbi:hypothetical protein L210DRAFT_3538419 [Boletus edulis BED1]|uniref:F-box domain-containing protein n=1 Tax=Boletus edulis BED1 TaxID=1328754 RepID=A0AAD4GG61_BOLED|nr:hypothetical protein L210DRAFT_3538419 [Boletus edulis BED1]